MNRLDHILTNNIKTNKNQRNDAIKNDPKFYNTFNLSSGNNDPLTVVTVSLQGGKKKRATTVACLTWLWDIGATDIMNKIKHTKYYEHKMRYNKVEYSTATGLYCTTHDVKVPFSMTELSRSKIIEHQFHVENDKGESGIGYDMIICRDLMVKLGLLADFKRKVLQWDGVTVPMK